MTISGILPVIPTPFAGGAFDPDSFQRFLDHMLADTDGYTLLGSTGEAPSLTVAERMTIAEAALEMTPRDKTVVVGISHTSVQDSIALAQHAQAHGAAGVLCSVPYYFPNSQDGVLRHLRQIDAVLDIDLVLYDNPVATKSVLPTEWVLRWADELPHLTSVKLTDHDLSKVPAWQAAGLSVLAGDDVILFQFLSARVDGAMVIAPAVLPASFRRVWDCASSGDIDGAFAAFGREIVPFIHAFGVGDEIAMTKALLAEIGVFASAEVRSPMNGDQAAQRQPILRQAYEIGLEAAARTSGAR